MRSVSRHFFLLNLNSDCSRKHSPLGVSGHRMFFLRTTEASSLVFRFLVGFVRPPPPHAFLPPSFWTLASCPPSSDHFFFSILEEDCSPTSYPSILLAELEEWRFVRRMLSRPSDVFDRIWMLGPRLFFSFPVSLLPFYNLPTSIYFLYLFFSPPTSPIL